MALCYNAVETLAEPAEAKKGLQHIKNYVILASVAGSVSLRSQKGTQLMSAILLEPNKRRIVIKLLCQNTLKRYSLAESISGPMKNCRNLMEIQSCRLTAF